MKFIDITNKKFGKWTVLGIDQNRKNPKDYNVYWSCQCECGFLGSICGSHLRLRRSLSCRQCSEKKHKNKLISRAWIRITSGAKSRNIKIDLGSTVDEAKDFLYDLLYNKQKSVCALSGLPIKMANTCKEDKRGGTTASLDRVDSSKGYTKDNVQWVHKWINKMKWNLSEDEFLTFCEAVVNYRIRRKSNGCITLEEESR